MNPLFTCYLIEMALIAKYLPTFQLICRIKSRQKRDQVLKEFCQDPVFCSVVRQIAKNTLFKESILPIKKSHIKRLKKHSHIIKGLARKKKGYRKLAVQSGGFLPIVIPLITSIIAEIIKSRDG